MTLHSFLRSTALASLAFTACLITTSCNKDKNNNNENQPESTTSSAPAEELGYQLPADMELTTPDGTLIKVETLYGKYLYVDVWASWCTPCRQEIPYLQALATRMSDQDKVQFVSISVDEKMSDWKAAVDQEQPSWPQYIVQNESADMLSQAIRLEYIPRFLIIDPEGNIINDNAPRPSEQSLEEELRKLE